MKPLRFACACVVALVAAGCGPAPGDASAPDATAPAATVPASTTEAPAPAVDAMPAPAPETALAASDATGPGWHGYGALRWGMAPEAMQAAWQPGTLSRSPGIGTDDTCHYLIPDAAAQDVRLMVEEGRFVRAEFLTDATTAPGGGKVGWTAAQIRAAYPAGLEELAHKYEDGALYLRIRDRDGEGVLLFETDANGVVRRWRMGIAPQIDYVEGCA